MKNYIDETIEFIKNYFKNDTTGHDFYHSKRVFQLADEISKQEECDIFIIQISSLLHDVDDRKLSGDSEGLLNTRQFLSSIHLSELQINKICDIIHEISYKGNESLTPSSIEGKIVQDADRLDAIGAIGIARAFTYGGSIQRNIYIPDCLSKENMSAEEYYRNTGSTINHFYEKLLKLHDLMNTETGKLLAKRRHHFMEMFLDEFYMEWNCGTGDISMNYFRDFSSIS